MVCTDKEKRIQRRTERYAEMVWEVMWNVIEMNTEVLRDGKRKKKDI